MHLAFDADTLRTFLEAGDLRARGDYVPPRGQTVELLRELAPGIPLVVPAVLAALEMASADGDPQKWFFRANARFDTPESQYLDEARVSARAQALAKHHQGQTSATDCRVIAECEEWWKHQESRSPAFALVTCDPARFDAVREMTEIKTLTPERALKLMPQPSEG